MKKGLLSSFAVVVLIFSVVAAEGGEVTFERYVLEGDLNNTGSVGGPVETNKNFSFVTLPNGKQVAENSMSNYEEPEALANLHAQVPPELRTIRVSAWIKTQESGGSIRSLYGTGMFYEKEIPTGLIFGFSNGRLQWKADGSNGRSHHIQSAQQVNDGVWHHVTAVSQYCGGDKAVVALYVDGKIDTGTIEYYSLMTPKKVQTDSGFGFKGQISRLELQNIESGPNYFTGSGETDKAIETDPLYDPATIPLSEKPSSVSEAVVKHEGVITIANFGAVGNGIVDDTKAILKAVAALNPTKGVDTLFFPGGTYKISQPLRLPNGVDVVGLGATIRGTGCPAIELVGDARDISFRYITIDGGPPAAIYQHSGTASHIYFERCDILAPGDGKLPPNDANDYKGRTSDGVLFTDVRDSTFLGCTSNAGRAFVAVEGYMSNLAVLRCLVKDGGSLTGFYFDTPDSGPALLLGNSVHCNMGYALTARAVQDMVVRGLTTEGMGVSLPKEAATGPMYDIRNGKRVNLEMFSLDTLQLNRPGYQHTTWEGPQLRLNGLDNTVAGTILSTTGTLQDASLESNDPNLKLWQINFPYAKLAFSGAAQKRVVVASQFSEGQYPAVVFHGEEREELSSKHLPISPEKRMEPVLWGPPLPRFNWGEMGFKSVRDYGAKGDGKTDEAPAFKQAAARSEVVYVPAGTYRLSSPFATTLPIIGDGKERTVLVADENTAIIEFPQSPPEVYSGVLSDLTFRGGKFGVYIPIQTAGWFISRVRFENPRVAGFAADSFDNGNVLVDCEFLGGQYGFVGGGWNRHFVDKTLLWRCSFDKQSENGIRIASVDGAPGVFIHTVLRDCTVRNSGSSGVVMMGHPGLFNFLDHCLIENCGQKDGAPYVSFIKCWPATALMYYTRVVHTQGPQPAVLVNVEGHVYMRFVDVEIVGAKGTTALRSDSAHAWIERVTADGNLQFPPGVRVLYADTPATLAKSTSVNYNGLWMVEWSRFSSDAQ